ncbi:hypothetical protein H5410_042880 [Solanum commersonii]|uniref:Uncharacterized protein n=1 Tax=Solanum commersonii TaxID=4109 RepID=A0A9J5XZV1_SOLCO|nr:hypothetical protein H5410_042880 [Solanum commersonii]
MVSMNMIIELLILLTLESLDLSENDLLGSVPSSIFNVSSLKVINLIYNALSGTLPNDICHNLRRLEGLQIARNQLSGQLPSNLDKCKELTYLSLSYNQFTGNLPRDMWNLTKLQHLFLGWNNITGHIPSEIDNLSAIRRLSLRRNNLVGSLPPSIGNLSNLEMRPRLSGEVPRRMYNISGLKKISLVANELSGTLPSNIGHTLPNLEGLYLGENQFTGLIPTSIVNSTKLIQLDFGRNLFSGPVPMNLGKLQQLQFINLQVNQLTNDQSTGELSFLTSLSNCKYLKTVQIGGNQFNGSLPKSFGSGNWSFSLEYFIALQSGITGKIPTNIKYGSEGKVSTKGDVYSFGILLMETFTRKSPVDDLFVGDFTLKRWICQSLPDRLVDVVDINLFSLDEENFTSKERCFKSIMELALECTNDFPEERIRMEDTTLRLKKILTQFLQNVLLEKLHKMVSRTIIIAFLVLLMYLSVTNASNISTDEASLLAFKAQITSDPNGILSKNWTKGTHICNWIGISCSKKHQRVTSLVLTSFGFRGSIAKEIGNLSFLNKLDVGNNSFHGQIPDEIRSLRRLNFLSLQMNNLTGQIPESLGFLTRLQLLDLSENDLFGNVPFSISNASSLKIIDLGFNRISGNLPRGFCTRLPNLKGLFLSKNQLAGQIPSGLNQCTQLIYLSLSYNQLTGSLPTDMWNLTKLRELYLGWNNITGHIPTEIDNLSAIRRLSLPQNSLVGILPPSMGNLSNLEMIDLGQNSLHGSIPQEFKHLVNLKGLFLGQNRLSGEVPGPMYNISGLEMISFVGNGLSGTLPSNIGHTLPNLAGLYFGNNQFTGLIPTSIVNSTKLIQIDFGRNLFSGPVPMNLEKLQQLQFISLQVNQLTNDPSMGELSFLTSLSNCKYLKTVQIGGNQFNGSLPKSLGSGNWSFSLEYFIATYSGITGKIPINISNFRNLEWLSLGENKLIEYGSEGKVSTKGDVYSFGILLMEAFTRKSPVDDLFVGDFTMKRWICQSFPNQLMDVVDINLFSLDEENFTSKERCFKSIMELALECTNDLPEERICMEDITLRLKKILTQFLQNAGRDDRPPFTNLLHQYICLKDKLY